MSAATALKFQNDAKQLAARRLQERKKGLMVLILRHLADSGYVDSYKKLEAEAGVSLEQVDGATDAKHGALCDNVDPTHCRSRHCACKTALAEQHAQLQGQNRADGSCCAD